MRRCHKETRWRRGTEDGEEAGGEVAIGNIARTEAEEEEVERRVSGILHGGPDFGGGRGVGE